MAEKPVKITPKVASAPAAADFTFNADIPEAAREALTKTVQTLKDKSLAAQATLNTATNSAEKIAAALVDSNIANARNAIASTFDNLSAWFAHVEKVVTAKTPADALQLNTVFVQSFAQANYDRAVAAAETLKSQIAGNAKLVQDEVAKLAPALKTAA